VQMRHLIVFNSKC